jgi:hypothetical protein
MTSGLEVMKLRPEAVSMPSGERELALARGPFGPKDPLLRRKVYAAIRRAIKIAEERGVEVIPIREARSFLVGVIDDPFERMEVIAAYDHLSDVIVFNPDHTAWADMGGFLRQFPGLYGTDNELHIVRHELGHAAYYHLLEDEGRRALWDADLSPMERVIARRVSYRATWNVKEFVAEVYAGLWAKREYDEEILRLHDQFRGPRP